MKIKEAVNILKQGLDIALSNGAFKKTEDVALLYNSLVEVQQYVERTEALNSEKVNKSLNESSKSIKKDTKESIEKAISNIKN